MRVGLLMDQVCEKKFYEQETFETIFRMEQMLLETESESEKLRMVSCPHPYEASEKLRMVSVYIPL